MQEVVSDHSDEPLRPWQAIAVWATITLFFLLMAVVQTWPLMMHAGDSIINWPHRPEDSWINLWNLAWVRDALEGGTNPFHTDRLFYPQGADLYMHTLATTNSVMSIPLQWITGNVILAWNILAIILFALSGIATYALAYRITKNHPASLMAGYIFAFSPFVMMRFHGHWNISTVWPLPLFALFLVRFQETGRLRDAALAGAAWSVITYNNLEFSSDAGIFLGLFFLYWSIVYLRTTDRRKRLLALWRAFPVVILVWVILSSALLLPALESIRNQDFSHAPSGDLESTDPLALVTPSPLWGEGKLPLFPLPPKFNHFPAGDIENTVYVGITPLILAAIGVLSIRRLRDQPVLWLAAFAAFTILAFGPHLYLDDTKEFSLFGTNFSIPLPYQIYDRMPILGERRGISRLIIFGHLGLAILAAIGAKVLLDWISHHGRQFRGAVPVIGLAVLCLVVFEYWTPPNSLSRLGTPQVLQEISHEPGNFAVIDAPLGRSTWTLAGTQSGALMADYYSRIYGKRNFGGYLSRAPNSTVFWIGEQPGIRYLSCPSCPGLPGPEDLDAAAVRATFEQYGVRYVVVHRITPSGGPVGFAAELDKLDSYVRTTLGMIEVHREDRFTLFRNDAVPAAATRAGPEDQ